MSFVLFSSAGSVRIHRSVSAMTLTSSGATFCGSCCEEKGKGRERESQRGPVCVRTPDLRYSSAGHEDFEPNISTQSAETQENATVVLSSRKGALVWGQRSREVVLFPSFRIAGQCAVRVRLHAFCAKVAPRIFCVAAVPALA